MKEIKTHNQYDTINHCDLFLVILETLSNTSLPLPCCLIVDMFHSLCKEIDATAVMNQGPTQQCLPSQCQSLEVL